MSLTQLKSLFDKQKNYVRFELILNAPFPVVVPPVIFTKLLPGDSPISYRLTSQTIREGSAQDFSMQMKGVVNMYPSLPATTLSFLTVDMAINSDEIADFSKIFGNDIWHSSHLYWQDRIFGEINDVIDLARTGKSPQYIIRNVSPFDMRSARIIAIEDEAEKTLNNYLLPQIVGEIDVAHDAIGRSVVPFYLVNYVDARRYCVECKYREMQISACNAIEAGSWHLWELAKGPLSLHPQSEREWHARYGAVAKGLSKELGEHVKQPKEHRDYVWRHRQKAMHGQNVRVNYQEAQAIIEALSIWMNYVEQVSVVLRKHRDPLV